VKHPDLKRFRHTTPQGDQPFAPDVEIDQHKKGKHPVAVCGKPSIANPIESELPLHDSKNVFDLGIYLRLSLVFLPL